MGEAIRRQIAAKPHQPRSGAGQPPPRCASKTNARTPEGNLKITLFRQGWHLELSRRARQGCAWSADRLRIACEAVDATDARPLPCAACNARVAPGLFPGWAIMQDQEMNGADARFVPLCDSCANLPFREAIERIGRNCYVGFEYGNAEPIE